MVKLKQEEVFKIIEKSADRAIANIISIVDVNQARLVFKIRNELLLNIKSSLAEKYISKSFQSSITIFRNPTRYLNRQLFKFANKLKDKLI